MILRGISFIDPKSGAGYHTGADWGLVMSGKIIGTPSIKFKRITLDDRDGDVDFTDALRGVPNFNNRTLEFTFEYLDNPHQWTSIFNTIRNFIHGQRLKIVEPDDHDYYFMGRCSVSDPEGGLVKKFKIQVDADTWKYKNGGETTQTETITAGSTVSLYNDWRPVVPSIIVSGNAEIRFAGETFNLSEGTFKIPKIFLTHGRNEIEIVAGSGSITFKYQEGAL